ncbi:ATP-binding protein [Candidatus Babeliales bacterium]|nr:ATP-binding protein [Candidatus Babeliales bacterium]
MMNYKKRINEDLIRDFSKLFKIIFLVGARQVGKSSLLAHLFPQYKAFVFDPIQDLYNVRKNPDLFLGDFKPPIILDEIQFVPELLPSLKRQVDLSDDKGQYFLTGSQQLSILKSVSESLAGRVVIIPVFPMTPHEMYATFNKEENWFLQYLKNPDTFFNDRSTKINIAPTRIEAIWRGGMPGTMDLPNNALTAYFSSYVQTYVERDVRLLENIEDLSKFGRFIALVASLTSQEINYSQLGRELGISPKTAERWLRLLMHTYQWSELQPFHMNAIKRLSLKPKGIIADTGLACYLQRISSPEALAASPMQGAFFESYCFNMIKGFCTALHMMPNFYHWRTLAGAEVDIIVEIDGIFYPIEVKTATTVSKNDIRGITAFKETYPKLRIAKGVVIYAGDECYHITKDTIAVPWNLQ